MTKSKTEKKAHMAKAIKEVLAGRKTGWNANDCAVVAIKLVKELPNNAGKAVSVNHEMEQRITAIFDTKAVQLEALKSLLAEANCTPDATTEAQLLQLLDTEQFRQQLIAAKLLTKKTRSTKVKLSDLMESDEETTEED